MSGAGRRTIWGIYRWPLAIAMASLVGLVSALVGDGWYDAVSWVLLGGIAALMGWLGLVRPRAS